MATRLERGKKTLSCFLRPLSKGVGAHIMHAKKSIGDG